MVKHITNKQLEKLEGLSEAVSQRPWRVGHYTDLGEVFTVESEAGLVCMLSDADSDDTGDDARATAERNFALNCGGTERATGLPKRVSSGRPNGWRSSGKQHPVAPTRPAGQNAGMNYFRVAAVADIGLLAAGLTGLWSETPLDQPSGATWVVLAAGVLIGLVVVCGSAVFAGREIRTHLREVPAGGLEADYHDIPEPSMIPATGP
jgi:hypothetical protein